MSAFRDSGGLAQVAAVHFRDASSVLTDAETGRFRNASNALKTFFSAMSAAIPATVEGFRNKSTSIDIITPAVDVVVTGGSSPWTYLWTRTDAGGDTWTISAPTAAETTFTAVAVDPGDTRSATFKCAVTDSGGAEADSNPIAATAVNLGGGGSL